MSTFASKLVIAALTLVMTTAGLAAATSATAAAGPLSCSQVQLFSTLFNGQIVDKLDQCAVGEVFEINRRKQIRIDAINEVSAEGCELRVVIAVTLKRKILRDVSGTVTARASVAAANDGTLLKVNFDRIRVSNVALEDIGEIREALFERIANRVLPSTYALQIDLASTPGDEPGGSCSIPR